MTTTLDAADIHQTPGAATVESGGGMVPRHHPQRWRLHRAGITNVWHYYGEEFAFFAGRVIWRGTNGAGKSRAMEMLLPFVFDADRRRMDSTGSGNVRLETLMRAGSDTQTNRIGYLWVELARTDEDDTREYRTLGAGIKYSASTTKITDVWYFLTPHRVGDTIELVDSTQNPLKRQDLAAVIGAEAITSEPATHRERVRAGIFGLVGESAEDRYDTWLQLLRVLRSPDVGNRIEEGKLPQILSDALPPLSDQGVTSAGSHLDGLSEARESQQQLQRTLRVTETFLDAYRGYAAAVLTQHAAAARGAADISEDAHAKAAEASRHHAELEQQAVQAAARVSDAEERLTLVRGEIDALRSSAAYADGQQLNDLRRAVDAEADAAVASLGTAAAARAAETTAVERADDAAREVAAAATDAHMALGAAREALAGAGVATSDMPTAVTATLTSASGDTDPVRTTLEADPDPLTRPAAADVRLQPDDLDAPGDAAGRAGRAAGHRATAAQARHGDAEALERQERTVIAAERDAETAAETAQREEDAAATAAAARDESARRHVHDWRTWVSDPSTSQLLPDITWDSTPVGETLRSVDILMGDVDGSADLDELQYAAQAAANGVRDQIAATLSRLDDADEAAAAQVVERSAERERWEASVEVDPPLSPWQATGAGNPLWRCVDFTDAVPDEAKPNLEGALLASGLLTAILIGDGTVTTPDGVVLVTTGGARAASPVTRWLRPDPNSPVAADVVTAVLDRISSVEVDGGTWVGLDGSWGNGLLRGRLARDVARHVGAAAREAERDRRIAAIDAELAVLAHGVADRAAQRQATKAHRTALTRHLRALPSTSSVSSARALASSAATRAADAHETAHAETARARKLRGEWEASSRDHRALCDQASLPHTAAELRVVQQQATAAVRACEAFATTLAKVAARRNTWASARARIDGAREHRADTEQQAETARGNWLEVHAELVTLEDSVGAEVAANQAKLAEATHRQQQLADALRKGRLEVDDLKTKAAKVEAAAEAAATEEQRLHGDLVAAVKALRHAVRVPGLVAALTPSAASPTATADGAEEAAREAGLVQTLVARCTDALGDDVVAEIRQLDGLLTPLLAGVRTIELNGLLVAERKLVEETTGTYDVATRADERGIHYIELTDADGTYPAAVAAARLRDRAEQARHALTEREQKVFTEFVVGTVGEELRRKMEKAQQLIDSMNASLADIKTSHGIQVRLLWRSTADPGTTVHRVRELCQVAPQLRPEHETSELVRLLMELVDQDYQADPTAGYAEALRRALDYRTWHHIEVQQRKPEKPTWVTVSRRAELSQGEKRFVAYVALFAAADAYLTGLSASGTAPRFIMLDDAFAKVDTRTIAELMGLLVRLDLDFAMTGHSLWGTFPEVPALDVYEVRREPGQPAVTTHVHWDGKNRHMRGLS